MDLIPTVDPLGVNLKPTRFSNYGERALFYALSELAHEFARRQPDIVKDDVMFNFVHDYDFETFIYWHACKQGCSDPNEVPF